LRLTVAVRKGHWDGEKGLNHRSRCGDGERRIDGCAVVRLDERSAKLAFKLVPFVALLIAGVMLLLVTTTTKGNFMAFGLALLGLAGSGTILLQRTRTSPDLAKSSKWVLAGVAVVLVLILLLLLYVLTLGFGTA
jgi:hypothetical protein